MKKDLCRNCRRWTTDGDKAIDGEFYCRQCVPEGSELLTRYSDAYFVRDRGPEYFLVIANGRARGWFVDNPNCCPAVAGRIDFDCGEDEFRSKWEQLGLFGAAVALGTRKE